MPRRVASSIREIAMAGRMSVSGSGEAGRSLRLASWVALLVLAGSRDSPQLYPSATHSSLNVIGNGILRWPPHLVQVASRFCRIRVLLAEDPAACLDDLFEELARPASII